MRDKRRFSISRVFLIGIILTSLLLSILLWGIWAYERHQRFQDDANEVRYEYIGRQKQLVAREADAAIDFIRFKRLQIEERVRQQLKDRVYEAHSIASHLYQKYKDRLPEAEIFDLIRESLRPIRFLHGRGYFFATGFDGTEQLFADRPEMEGMNLLNIKDTQGKPIIREMIELATRDGEGFYSYNWTKPEAPGRDYPKLSFIKRFGPADWFIGAGEYIDDMETDIRKEVLERLAKIRFGNDNYLFVMHYDSSMLVHPSDKLRGRRMAESKTERFRDLFSSLMAASADTGNGFYEYSWAKPTGNGHSQKVTYVTRLPEWDWMIGAGFHLDDVELQIASERTRLAADLRHDLFKVGLLLFLAIIAALTVARQISQRISANLQLFNHFFSEAADSSHQIDIDRIGFIEFAHLAQSANRMIDQRDRSEQAARQLEAQLQQRQKLEAIGTLAGGIAHDFNNLLAVVFGNISLLKMRLASEDPSQRYLVRIDDAASRARDLVSQILTFSRRTEVDKRPVDLTSVVREATSMLRSTIPRSIAIEMQIAATQLPALADTTQMHQVVMNLCTNASHALEQGGRIDILLEKVAPEDNPLPSEAAIHLMVADDGPGISKEHLTRIFDPFYSTKEIGKGTGLGLSVVHSIVEAHQGQIKVESTSDSGTKFHIFLPYYQGEVTDDPGQEMKNTLVLGAGSILLVDDEESVLQTQKDLLKSLGYRVKTYNDPLEAREELYNRGEPFDLLVTDQTMPGLSGLELAQEARKLHAKLPIILCTGYSAAHVEAQAQALAIDAFLMKPIIAAELSQTVARLLGDGEH